tara:strand:- start:193 stop:1449 length:1257 start_codon:yes stop_codon:yes gene_type:complete
MAINYLNSISLNKNELLQGVIENQANDAAAGGSPVEGQLYFNTTDHVLKQYNGTAWEEVGGGVVSLTAGTYLTNSGTATDPIIDHDDTSRTDATSTASPGYGASFSAVDSVTTNATGHVTGLNLKTVTLPASDNTDNYVDSVAFDTATGVLTLGRTGALVDLTKNLDGRYGLIDGQTVELTGDITGTGTTSIATTISAGAVDFAMVNPADVITESEGIGNNDNDTTWPTTAAVKDYVDSSTAGQLVYQGGYNAATNTPNLDNTPTITIKIGFTWTVTADGDFYGEQVRVGDLLISEVDTPTSLADWTTVQNNIDLADAATVGIGNVAAGTGISVAYSSGTATVTNTDTNTSNTATGAIAIGALSGTVNHTFGVNTIVQTIDSSGNTVICDISRTATTSTATIAATELTAITILVQKIG